MADDMGMAIAKAVPPPSKLKGGGSYGAPMGEPDGDEGMDEDRDARIGMMQEFLDLIGSKADAGEACDALDRYLDARGR